MNFQPPEYDDPRDDEDRMNDGIRAMLADNLGFSIEERAGCPVINEDGDMREADLCHRVLWDEMVSLTAELDSLRAVNAELLELLDSMKVKFRLDDPFDLYDTICAAIASARKQ